jgi:hypothetical protein
MVLIACAKFWNLLHSQHHNIRVSLLDFLLNPFQYFILFYELKLIKFIFSQIDHCMWVYNPKYNSWNVWEAMGTFGSVEIGRKSAKSCFSVLVHTLKRASPRQGEVLRWPAGKLRWPAGKLRWPAGKLREPAGKLRWLAGSCGEVLPPLGKSFSSLGKLSNTLFIPFLSRVGVVLWS